MKKHKHIVIGAALAVVLMIAAGTFFVIKNANAEPTKATKEQPVGAAVPSHFAFKGVNGWWQGATSASDIALFARDSSGCFVSVQYKPNGTIAASQAKQQKTDADSAQNGYVIAPVGTQTLTMQTDSGLEQYDLAQSSTTSKGVSEPLMGGQEYGYIQLKKGYIYVMANCNTAEQLPATLPVLQAVSFDATKVTAHK